MAKQGIKALIYLKGNNMSQDKINDMIIRSLSSSLHEIEKENIALKEQLKEANEVIGYFANLDEDDIERCHGFQAKYMCEEYKKKWSEK